MPVVVASLNIARFPQPLLQGVSKDADRKQGLGDRKQHVRHWKQQVRDKI